MLESKGKIHIGVIESKKTPDVVCVVSIPCDADVKLFKHATNGLFKDCQSSQSFTDTIVAWSFTQCCNHVLRGTPMAVIKTRVNQFNASVSDGYLNIIFGTQGNMTYVRKCLTLALKCLTVVAYSTYEKNCKAMGLKPSRDEFEKSVASFTGNAGSGVSIAIVGKIKADNDSLGELRKKLEELLPSGKSKKTSSVFDAAGLNVIKVGNYKAFVLSSYIKALGGVNAEVINNNVVVSNPNWDTIKKKIADKDKINLFIERKFGKKPLEDHLSAMMAYIVACSGDTDAHCVLSAKKVVVADIEKEMLKLLKS
jgi:hypothetical protein